ncbi:MAG: GHKL domain-containing protein [Clostridia bacterium]|nr:GHKL domain-containing protein [Clostridia bacterium]
MKGKIFLRFFIITALTALVVFLVGLLAVSITTNNLVKERLQAETRLVCLLVNEESDYNKFEAYFNNDEFRTTIIDLNGDVLHESDVNESLENHSNRQEFILALQGKSEPIERYSDTLKCNMTYYAQMTTLNSGEQIVIRLALKSSFISDYALVTLPLLAVVLIATLVASVVFATMQAKTVANCINEVGKSLKSLNEGTYLPISADASDKELVAVYDQINELSVSLLSYIVKEELERKKLDSVLSNVSQGIIALTQKNTIAFVNKSAKQLFLAQEDLNKKHISLLIKDDELCKKIEGLLGEDIIFESEFCQKILSISLKKTVDSTLTRTFSNIIIITDVTIEKQIAKQKSEFFANASHELKTPVTVMQGLSEILLEKNLDEFTHGQIERIYKESQRLSALISDMLKLSKLERDKQSADERETVEIKKVTEEVLNELSPKITQKQIAVSVVGEGSLFATQKHVYELIGNLLSNAINYNKVGGKVETRIISEKDLLAIEVEDTGIGIESEHIPRLCERFYRVDKSRSKKTGGTGLGLAIVKHVCALYGGEITIRSQVGKGTIVRIEIPKR